MPRTSSRKGPTGSATSTSSSSPVDLFRFDIFYFSDECLSPYRRKDCPLPRGDGENIEANDATGKAASKELERIDQLFYSYASNSSGMIEPEGIESLCSDLEVDHTDVRILVLAWKMQAEKQGYFILDEWRRGLKALRADTMIKVKKALPDLEKEVRRQSTFEDFYAYAFRYCLTEEQQKSIDIESICVLLDLVLGFQFGPQVDYLVHYLRTQTDYKVINMDQWMGFYRFCTEISFPDLSNYDPNLAWPWILDNFVDWMRAKQG